MAEPRPRTQRLPVGTVLPHPCPDCGAKMMLRDSRFGPFYGCASYPRCKATHGAHKATGEPLGTPATPEVKVERQAAHALFDLLWKGDAPRLRRHEAYAWMAARMGLEKDQAHIGMFGAAECQRLRALVVEHFPDLAPAAEHA